MWLLLLLLFFQSPSSRSLLELENSRTEDVSVLLAALKDPDPRVQRLAVRALGRLERDTYREAIIPLLRAPEAEVRRRGGRVPCWFDAMTWCAKLGQGRNRGLRTPEAGS